MPYLLSATMARALSAPIEVTIRHLLNEYGFEVDKNILFNLQEIQNCLDAYDIRCSPPIGHGGIDDYRVLSSSSVGSVAAIIAEISELETARVEFKSSLIIDRKRKIKDPGRAVNEYRSEAVIHSCLKTVAGFANAEGGTLYVGVEDTGSICGLADDFHAASSKADFDGWDLHFRNMIRDRFSDGPSLNSYVSTKKIFHDGYDFVRVEIAPRKRLTFLKRNESWELFIRNGTQTNSIPYCDVEQHFSLQRLY